MVTRSTADPKCLLLVALFCLCVLRAPAAELPQARLDETHRAFFKDYCVECHNEKKHKGKLRLDNISFAVETVEQADRWQKILNQLNSGEMPPDDAQQPERERKTDFLDALSHTLVAARKIIGDQSGRITMRRLNQREYKNTIRDLLGVEVNVRDLPADGGTGTFDTVGASLFMSSDQIEQYLALGRRALDEFFARAADPPQPGTLKVREEAEVAANRQMNGQLKHLKETHEKYVCWTAAVDEAAARPENLEIAAKLRKNAEKPRPSSGVPYATPMLFYHDWDKISGAPPPDQFGFKDAQAAFFDALQYKNFFSYYTDYQSLPNRDTGAWLLFYQAYRETHVSAEKEWPAGRYTLRMRVAANDAAPKDRCFLEVGQRGDDVSDFTVLSAHQVTGTLAQPQVIELPVNVTTSGKREFAVREKRPNWRTAEIRSYFDVFEKTGHGPVPAIWIDWLEVEGPARTRCDADKLLPASAHDNAGAREVIERFATRAFRGAQPAEDYLGRLVALFERHRGLGDSFEESLKEPLSVVLASPGFLYLNEASDEKGHRRLNSFELAARLSYFLWSGPPDDELLALARSDALQDPVVLAAQADRLLADEKSWQLMSGFTHQWLGMDRLDFFQFDFKLHRGFDDSTKAAAREEVYRTFGYLVRENLGLCNLLKSDFAIVNGLLASYYGIEGITGDQFRKVSLPADSPRGGLLGMAAILAMGSNGSSSSPVERGAWVLRKLLHDPPPPAPPNVPQLARLGGKLLTTRERLRAHQEEPQCANCHRKIDPIGFGLENFDAAGLWRSEDRYEAKGLGRKTWLVDPAGAFYRGPAFKDYFELRDIVASKPERFARGFTEALIEYALGRPCGFSDEDLVTGIVQLAGTKDYSVRAFIHALIASDAFQMK